MLPPSDRILTGELLEASVLLEGAGVGLVVASADGDVLVVNGTARELLGPERAEELLADGLRAGPTRVVRPDGTPLAAEELPSLEAIATGAAAGRRIIGVRGADRVRWLVASAVPLRDDGGRVVGSVATLVEVDDTVAEALALVRQVEAHGVHLYRGRYLEDGSYEELETGPGEEHFLGGPRPRGVPAVERWSDAVHPDDWASYENAVQRLRRGAPEVVTEYRMRGADGRVRWARDRIRVAAVEGSALVVDGLVVDVTEERAVRDRLADAAHQLEQRAPEHADGLAPAIEHALEEAGIVLYGLESEPGGADRVLYRVGPEAALLGLPPGATAGAEAMARVVIDADRAAYARAYADLRSGVAGTAEYGVRLPDGAIRWLRDSWVASRRPDGTGSLAFGVILDVTGERSSREEHGRVEASMRAVAAMAPIGLTVLGPDLEVLRANDRARELWGDALGVERGARVLDDAVDLGRALEAGEDIDRSCRMMRPDGSIRWVHLRARTLRDAGGQRVATVIVEDDVTEVHRTRQELLDALGQAEEARLVAERLSRVDAVTGMPNRRAAIERLAQGAAALLIIDADHFKRVNDLHGHRAGDDALRALAGRIREAAPPAAHVARWGGEEFSVILGGAPDEPAVRRIGEDVRAAIAARPIRAGRAEVELTVSVGAARARSADEGGDRLVERADRALYAAKHRGRDRVCLDVDLRARDREEQPEGLHAARLLVESASAREGVPVAHSEEVAELAAALARRAGLGAEQVARARVAGLLHDIGKVAVPDDVLAKPGPLDAAERRAMEAHPSLGADLAAGLPLLAGAAPAIRHHHERWDGAGYPDGLAGEAIPLEARIVAVADAWSAMRIARAHAPARADAAARAELAAAAGGQLDPALVALLVDLLDQPERRHP